MKETLCANNYVYQRLVVISVLVWMASNFLQIRKPANRVRTEYI